MTGPCKNIRSTIFIFLYCINTVVLAATLGRTAQQGLTASRTNRYRFNTNSKMIGAYTIAFLYLFANAPHTEDTRFLVNAALQECCTISATSPC
ncbi:hypothetical protein PF005_g5448 [Phytophthora fragariae]|uniref:Uncharacterized protein n=1 Tax=Phytophthora fragariae TaxID=53985 RepID=A0A6A3FSV6_9STRA|nr:hypothetical protein PF003_g20966 [Phytophthora fragariae]KAE8948639.1 hypothetical protein PF009_g1761 [Phytophthora fragariae]KAE9022860.1 hypothetical protein PF011_g4269 [Phytophthora fragariae]KAE9127703.1 hypothetical protein PF007_g5537 [Phytophthora fragariae]KAE9128011.1 hypothetical protein PF010_g4674 [Phytophthora fragariae]